jgi:flagellar hook-associated protein 2
MEANSVGSNFEITQSLGGGSAFDTQKIITSLVAVKQVPITTVETKKTNSETKLTSLGSIVSEVQSLKTTFEKFSELGPIDYTSLTSINGFTVTAKAGIAETSYGIKVDALASAAKARSNNIASTAASPGTGSLQLSIEGSTYDISVSVTDDYEDIVASINASGAPVTAALLTSAGLSGTENYLSITRNETGYTTTGSNSDAFVITSDTLGIFDTSSRSAYVTQEATNSQITVDGDLVFVRTSNIITDALPGLDVGLMGVTSTAETLQIGIDSGASIANIKTLTEKITTTIALLNAELDNAPGTSSSKTWVNDFTLKRLRRQLGDIVSTIIPHGGTMTSLASIGMKSDSKTGAIVIDETKLLAKIGSHGEDVKDLFTYDTTGIIDFITNLENEMNNSASGALTKKSSSLSDKISDYTDKIEDMNSDLLDYETQIVRQFSAMEERVGNYNAMKSYLEMQMDMYTKDN